MLQEPGSYVGEVVKLMGKKKILVKARKFWTPRISRQQPASLCIRAVQVQPEGKYVVELDKSIDLADVKPNLRVALRNDSYALHKVRSYTWLYVGLSAVSELHMCRGSLPQILPSKVDPLVSLMKVEKVPDSV